MELKLFNTLSEQKKYRDLLMNGVCIADRKTEDSHILLFQLHSFYVEVYFNPYGDEVVYTHSFDSVEELQPYLEQVNISSSH